MLEGSLLWKTGVFDDTEKNTNNDIFVENAFIVIDSPQEIVYVVSHTQSKAYVTSFSMAAVMHAVLCVCRVCVFVSFLCVVVVCCYVAFLRNLQSVFRFATTLHICSKKKQQIPII